MLTAESRAQMERFRAAHETKVLTILISDLEGSTASQHRLGNVRAAELVAVYRSVFRRALQDVEGQEVETAGDSFLIVFAAPSEAAKYALRVQAAMREARRRDGDLAIARIGIHQGQVVVERHEDGPKALDIYGLQVSAAARIADLARGGQILLSRAVFDDARAILRAEQLAGLGAIGWRNHGPYRFKGVPDLYEVCEVGEEGWAALAPPPAGAKGWPADHAEEELGWRPAVGVAVAGTNWVLQQRLGATDEGPSPRGRAHEGRFGEVWKAWNPADRSCQVFKFCFRREHLVALKRESRLLKRLRTYRHPNLVDVYDVTEGDRPPHYLEMEYVEGPSLREWLAGGPPLEQRLEVVAQVADALDTVHAAGIYHRDIKPSNILLTYREDGRIQAKLTDFGLGAAQDPEILHSLESTRLEAVVGTWDYIAPELRKGGAASAQTDLYSLGVALYQVAVGDLCRPLGDWEADVDSDVLREDIRRCIATDPARRWTRAADLARALRSHDERTQRLALERAEQARRRRARRIRRALAAAGVLALAALAALLYWWFLPGTLEFEVTPPGARIAIAGRTLTAGPSMQPVSLRAGHYEATITAPDHFPETRGLLVRRGRSTPLRLALRHHQGFLEAECEPLGSEIEVNGLSYGSRIRNLPLNTGHYRLLAWSVGHFECRREADLALDQCLRQRFWLDRGVHWPRPYTSPAIQGAAFLVADMDRDGLPDIAQNELNYVKVLSSADGEVLAALPAAASGSRTFVALDLGGKVGAVLVGAKEEPTSDDRQGGLDVFCIRVDSPGRFLWRWPGPRRDWKTPEGAAVQVVGDVDGDGVGELAVASRDAVVYVLGGATGKAVKQIRLAERPLAQPPGFAAFRHDGDARLVFVIRGPADADAPDVPRPYTGVCLRLEDGAAVWRKDLGRLDGAMVRDLDGDGTVELTVWRDADWQVLDVRSGSPMGRGALPAPTRWSRAPALADLDGDGVVEFLAIPADASPKATALRWRDGRALWESTLALTGPQPARRDGLLHRTARGELLVATADALAAVDPGTGKLRWRLPGVPQGVLTADWDGDGEEDVLVGTRGRGLTCLDSAGAAKWTLRLDVDVSPYCLLPDTDRDGLPEILIHRHAALFASVRGPRTLWACSATGPLQATPLVIDADGDGRCEVIQLGPWGRGQHLRCLAGDTGAVRWGTQCLIAPNRAPAIADWDGDGRPDVVDIGRMPGMAGSQLVALRASDGKPLSVVAVGEAGAIYSTPVVSDFNADGQPDLALHRWDRKDIVAVDGRSGRLLWRHPTGDFNMGTVGLADLNGDGRGDVIAASIDGHVHALDGATGKPLWPAAPIGRGGSRGAPLLHDLTGDGRCEVLIVAQDGAMYVIDGATGKLLWRATVAGASEAVGRPAVAKVGQATICCAPLGRAGVVAFDFGKRTVVWRSPEGAHVQAAPVVADLDRDAPAEVVVGTDDGRLLVLDLATGSFLWQVRLGDKPIEADPAVADLDGDGLLDILLAGRDFKLTALSGRATAAARKKPRLGGQPD